EVRPLAAPLDGRKLSSLGDGLAVLQVALVVVEAEVVHGVGHDLAPLVLVQLVGVDDGEPAAALRDDLPTGRLPAVAHRDRGGGLPAAARLGAVALHCSADDDTAGPGAAMVAAAPREGQDTGAASCG